MLVDGCLGIAFAMAEGLLLWPLAVGSPGAALCATPLAPLLPPPLSSPMLVEGCLGITFAMAEGLLPALFAVGPPGAALGAMPLTPLLPPSLFSPMLVARSVLND